MPRTRYLNKKSLAETLALFVDGLDIRRREAELVAVEDSLHRITAEPILARSSAPHYHGAAMDGIAVRAEWMGDVVAIRAILRAISGTLCTV